MATDLGSMLGGGGVKSVQRGLFSETLLTTHTITISSIDMSKSVVIINSDNQHGSSDVHCTVILSSSTSLTVGNAGTNSLANYSFAWQVVEYN